jgi:hypothetical protein
MLTPDVPHLEKRQTQKLMNEQEHYSGAVRRPRQPCWQAQGRFVLAHTAANKSAAHSYIGHFPVLLHRAAFIY